MKAARQQQIVELLNQHHTLTTEALSHLLQVSIETIRRDLSELQKQGRIQRSHGQARVLQRNNHNGEKPFQRRVKSHYAHKSDIARTALAWIDEGMTIALDASSTCWFLARQLPNMTLTVFTNSHPVCVELGRRERIQLISAGGSSCVSMAIMLIRRCFLRSNRWRSICLFFPARGSITMAYSGIPAPIMPPTNRCF